MMMGRGIRLGSAVGMSGIGVRPGLREDDHVVVPIRDEDQLDLWFESRW